MNLFELFVKIGVDDQASKNINNITTKLGNGLKTAAKIGSAAVAVAATAITALTAAAVKNYAEYEQLAGGVETLFKDSSSKAKGYASEAYKTASLSANEYMSTVTSFSASLLQSLDGDTKKAADYANRAIMDMSDNANKMGTDMTMIQNAYQGFAKQNYTMLDNLKLGYGGTKTEMQRLIKDAAAMTDIQKELNITVEEGNMSFSNIVNAISVVQSEMGIMGTTAAEAVTTISGSLNSAKAALQNLLTGFGDENADLDVLMDNFLETIFGTNGEGGVLNNLLPRIEITLESIITFLEKLLIAVAENLPGIAERLLPKLGQAILNVIDVLLSTLDQNADKIMDASVDFIVWFIRGLLDRLPELIGVVIDLVAALISAIGENLPELIPAITKCIENIVAELTSEDNIKQMTDAGADLIVGLFQGMIDAAKDPKKAFEIIKNIVMSLLSVPFDLGYSIGEEIANLFKGPTLTPEGTGLSATKQPKDEDKPDLEITDVTDDNPEDPEKTTHSGKNVTVNQYIYSQSQTAADLAEETITRQEMAVLFGV